MKNKLKKLYPQKETLNKTVHNREICSILFKLAANDLRPELFLDVLANPQSEFFLKQEHTETPTNKQHYVIKKKLEFKDTPIDELSNKLKNIKLTTSTQLQKKTTEK